MYVQNAELDNKQININNSLKADIALKIICN
jgi:hypothetical protein